MKYILSIPFVLLILISSFSGNAQNAQQWPVTVTAKSGAIITVYQSQPEKMSGNKLSGRSAFSVKEKASDDPLFGVFWFEATMSTNRDTRIVTLENLIITALKLPGVEDTIKISKLKKLLETELPKSKITGSLDDITTTLEQGQDISSTDLKNEPPVIHYKSKLTTLVIFDGEPVLKDDEEMKMKRVINTAFLIVQNPDDKKYYLYGGLFWYVSSSLKDGYKLSTSLPSKIKELSKKVNKEASPGNLSPEKSTVPELLISTVPAELIQSKGVAEYANISGTGLLYVSNSDDDIFKNINDQNFYVLLSGRWYTAPKLDGTWTYIASDKLPADFAKIPEGSDKDNVLSSVAGTPSSKEAVMDAQIPQTAKVSRDSAKCTVKYDGDPKFEKIEGTSMELAMNTSSTIIKSDNKYYCVETGVWFISDKATGPWKVSDQRPTEVDKIPASSQAYSVKYVYVYESTPEYVYVGYTPGYMGCYVYGPTVVYGTGYYYNPWYGPYYYPMPVTYGYSMHYNPYTGWSMGFHFSSGCFSYHAHYHPGYWGPPMYRPPYYAHYHGGMYGPRGPVYIHNDINIDRSNNIYKDRTGARTNDINTNDVKRGQGGNRPSNQPSNQPSNRPSNQPANQPSNRPANQPAGPNAGAGAGTNENNRVYGDKSGNVYQQNNEGGFDQRNNNNNNWSSSPQPNQDVNRDAQNRERSAQRNSGFDQTNRGGNMGGGNYGGGGGNYGGGRPAGGGGGGGRGGGGRR